MRLPARIVLASANEAKAAELTEVLNARFGELVELVARPSWVPEVSEDAADFEGNARLKALALLDATGEASLADDAGLEVDVLRGAPGVHSARFAGEHATDTDNLERLRRDLAAMGEPGQDVSARFRCALVLVVPGGEELAVFGTVQGRIVDPPRGESGFGYDPLFVPSDGDGRTFAEMSSAEKHAISHRGRALAALAAALAPPALLE